MIHLLVNAMSGGNYPFRVYQYTPAPMADETEFRMQQLKRHLPGPRASFAGFAVKDAPSSGGGGCRRRASVFQRLHL